jgi:Leucine-rich repeat (LRR) protein
MFDRIRNYLFPSAVELPKIHAHIRNYLSYQSEGGGNDTERLVDLIITNLTKEVFDSLSKKEKDVISLIHKNIVLSSFSDKHPEWVKPSCLFLQKKAPTSFAPTQAICEQEKSWTNMDAELHLDEWEFYPSKTTYAKDIAKRQSGNVAIEHIKAFTEGKTEILDLRGLGLTSLPRCIFTDERFKECLFEENPLKHFPKNLPIGKIQNVELFDKMRSIIAIERGKLSQKVFSNQAVQASINAFTDLSQDTAVNKEFAKIKKLQYRVELQRYREKIDKDFSLKDAVSEGLQKEIEDLLIPSSVRNYEREKICTKKAEKIYTLHASKTLLDCNLIKMFPCALKVFPPYMQERWQYNPWSQKKLAEEMRSFLQANSLVRANIQKLECKNINLSIAPSETCLFINLEELFFDNNQIASTPSEIMELWRLKSLSFYKNKITTIPPEIKKLIELQSLIFSDNKITEIPSEIMYLRSLKYLDLSRNKIVTIPQAIGFLTNLISLNLIHNKITKIPPELCFLKKLKWLRLSCNQITTIPLKIKNLTNLQELYLYHNKIKEISYELCFLKKLIALDLGYNEIVNVPPETRHLSQLQKLFLEGNKITHFPLAILSLKNLNELFLNNNQITIIPQEIELTKLKTLVLSRNKIIKIPLRLCQLRELILLNLAYNSITTVPQEIVHLQNLQELCLNNNKIMDFPLVITLLDKLKKLSLNSNQIATIPTEIEKLLQLKELNLSKNLFSDPNATKKELTALLPKCERIWV